MKNVLKLTKPMMHGSAVKRIQEFLDVIPQDGIFGKQTEHAVKVFQRKALLRVDGIVGKKTMAVVKGAAYESDSFIADIRHLHPKPRGYKRKRSWRSIVGVTLHQTGCDMPNNPENCGRLNAHYLLLRSGTIVHVNDEKDFIWHAQGFSSKTIGVEIEGNFPGIEGDLSTLWKGGGPGYRLNKEQLIASRFLFDHIRLQFLQNGAKWTRIFAHRQSSNTRVADPGSNIWREVALVWAKNLGLKDSDGGNFFKAGNGSPIPREWDPERTTKYK